MCYSPINKASLYQIFNDGWSSSVDLTWDDMATWDDRASYRTIVEREWMVNGKPINFPAESEVIDNS